MAHFAFEMVLCDTELQLASVWMEKLTFGITSETTAVAAISYIIIHTG